LELVNGGAILPRYLAGGCTLATNNQDEQRLALFIDFENIAIGVRDAHYRKFDVNLVLERLLDKGKLLVKKAYADWSRYSDYKRSFHESAIELIEVPQKSIGGKNSADIRLVVDAMDMSFQKEHVNCFVIASGDSDFSPLVSKLKENNKYVIGLGVKNSTSDLLIENCDEFIFYEDLVRGQQRPMPQIGNLTEKQQECFGLLVDSVLALQRENKEVLWGSMVKETMKRKRPQFNETYFGFRTFSHLLEDAQRKGVVKLRRDQKSGSYIIEDLGAAAGTTAPAAAAGLSVVPKSDASMAVPALAMAAAAPAANGEAGTESAEPAAANGQRPRRRRGRGRRGSRGGLAASAEAAGDAHASALDEHDEGDHDDDGEDFAAAEEGHDAEAPQAEAKPAESAPEAPAAEVTDSRSEAEREAERSFSIFSWLRRDE
jgi:uncharacterized LabA/DUF88 family protein